MGVYSIQYFSQQYLHLHSESFGRALTDVEERRLSYNFRAIGFNMATISAISLLACSIFSSSLLLFGLSAACYFLREAFSTSLDCSIVANYLKPVATQYKIFHLSVAEAVETRVEFAARMARKTLSIGGDWQAVKFQIFNLRLWMNLASLEEPVVAVQFRAEPVQLPVNGRNGIAAEQPIPQLAGQVQVGLEEVGRRLEELGNRFAAIDNPPVDGHQIEGG